MHSNLTGCKLTRFHKAVIQVIKIMLKRYNYDVYDVYDAFRGCECSGKSHKKRILLIFKEKMTNSQYFSKKGIDFIKKMIYNGSMRGEMV